MTEQEKNQLIEEAKNRYLPGTKIKSAYTGSVYDVVLHDKLFITNSGNIDNGGKGYLYYNANWAEIISKPESNLKVEDLVEGEVYCGLIKSSKRIVIFYPEAFELYELDRNNYRFKSGNSPENIINIKLATPEEKQWLEVCIKANKFISKEEALKSTETKFEVGKWYKINNCWYAKFNMIHGQNTYWQYTESITFQGVYNKLSDNIKTSSIKDGLSVVLLTDLREIQQYLPDNHPDKIKVMKEESLVGRYLKALVDRPNGIGLANKGDYFIINDLTCCTLIKNGTNRWLYHLRNNISKDFELMPEGFNPLAISESTDTNWIPKIGEWVIFLGGYSDLKLNKAYQIQEHQFEDYYYLKGTGLAPKKDKHFRKALPHEIPNNEIVLTPETYGYLSNRYFISVGAEEHSITPKQAIKSIFDKDYSSPLNEVLELPKSSKKKTKQLIY
jgi:hypothetical protein